MSNKLQVLGDKILVEKIEESSSFGMHIPDSCREKPTTGYVRYIGDGQVEDKMINISLKINQKILFQKWSGKEIKIENKNLLCMSFSDVIASFIDEDEIEILGDNVLVSEIKTTNTEGYSITPKSCMEKSNYGKVEHVGNGVVKDKTINMPIEKGDLVFFKDNSLKIEIDNKEFLQFSLKDIIAVNKE